MAGSLQESSLYKRLFPTGEVARLFTDTAEVRAMMLVEGTLARAQGTLGLIPEISAAAIHRAALEIPLDPGGMAAATGQNGVPVPALVAAFRKEMQAPEHAQYIHFGATSQDIQDTALMLRLRQMLALNETALRQILANLSDLAETHAALPMSGRTYGQQATVVSFGSVVAHWGLPLLDALNELPALRAASLRVSLSGASGTGAAFGPEAAALRTALADALGLADPGHSWHSDRGAILRIAGWLARVTAAIGKMAEDLILLIQSGINEITLSAAGGSSTMPQKQNPVQPSALVALSRHVAALHGALLSAASPRQERDGAAWFTEWLTLPQLCLSAASALEIARNLAPVPDAATMLAAINSSGDLIHAEALSFALARTMPRPDAQTAVKMLCQRAIAENRALRDLAAAEWPDADFRTVFDASQQMGDAPREARNFAAQVRALTANTTD